MFTRRRIKKFRVSFRSGLVLSRPLNVRHWLCRVPHVSSTHVSFPPWFLGRVKSILVPEEPLTPGLLYVGVSALTGSILARNRSIFVRFALPPTLLLLSFDHFLPKTYNNLSSYLGTLEDKYLPAVAEKHDIAKAHTAMTWERFKHATRDGRTTLGGGVEKVVHKAQDTTGLKFTEVLGWGKGVSDKALVAAQEIVEQAKEVEQNVEHVVEKKLAEVTHQVEEQVEKVEEKKDAEIKRLV